MATPGQIALSTIPGWPTPADGIFEQCGVALINAGFSGFVTRTGANVSVSDVPTAQNFFSTYSGSALELQFWQAKWQTNLDNFLNSNFDLLAFIRAGTNSSLTGTNVGNFLATITNNYRSLRSQIAAATTVAQVQAININSGWPSNP